MVTAACTERDDPSRSMLGADQEAWLFDGFRRAEARWNIIAQDLLVASLSQPDTTGASAHWTDGWGGFPACRARVLDAIAQSRLANPVFLGGDVHAYFVADLKADFEDAKSATVATKFVGTSITSEWPPYDRFSALLPDNPHIRFFDSRQRGYLAADVTPARLLMQMQVISNRRDPNATRSTLRRWVVEDGRVGAVEA